MAIATATKTISENETETLSPRLQGLRKRVVRTPQEISLVRALAVTDIIKANPDQPRGIQLALGLKETFRRLPITIGDEERIVGALTEKFKGAVLCPEVKSEFLIKELDDFGEREQMPFLVSEEEKQQLRQEILPYWDKNSALDDMLSRQSQETLFNRRNAVYVITQDFGGAAHLAHINYRKVLEEGFSGIIQQAEAARAGLPETDHDVEEKRSFYQTIILSAEAVTEFAGRYSQLALDLACSAASEVRAQELRYISEITSRVPARPARTFREAVQGFWFTYLALMNVGAAQEVPMGRLDQILYPYYLHDIEEGKITRHEALELIEELFIKFNQLTFLGEKGTTQVQDGNTMRPTLTVGGVDGAGNDATNEVGFLILDATDNLRLIRPNIAVRLHPDSPVPFAKRVIELMTNGGNVIEVFNDEPIIEGFTRRGFPIEVGRDYIVGGCVQQTPASTYGPNCSAHLNGPKLLEMFLNGGKPMLSYTGDEQDLPVPQYDSYKEFWGRFKEQLRSGTESMIEGMYQVGETHHRLLPNPILSAVIDGTLENGKDIKAGGARYNFTGMTLVGLGTTVDSLAAIREVVFEKRTHSLGEIVKWIKADFEGYEPQRQMLLNRTPKFGNGDPKTDEIAKEIVDWLAETFSEHRTYRGGSYGLGLHSETFHIALGAIVAASADGRQAGEMLSPGVGPTSGMDRKGPTARNHRPPECTLRYFLQYALQPNSFPNPRACGTIWRHIESLF